MGLISWHKRLYGQIQMAPLRETITDMYVRMLYPKCCIRNVTLPAQYCFLWLRKDDKCLIFRLLLEPNCCKAPPCMGVSADTRLAHQVVTWTVTDQMTGVSSHSSVSVYASRLSCFTSSGCNIFMTAEGEVRWCGVKSNKVCLWRRSE